MGAVAMLAANEIRRRRVRIGALTLLVGIVGAVVFASAAGARRSGSSLRRFDAYSRTADVEIDTPRPTPAQLRRFERLPDVVSVAVMHVYAFSVSGNTNLPIGAPVDNALGTIVDRARLIRGRRARRDAVDEITIGEGLAHELHVGPGDSLDALSLTPAQLTKATTGGGDPGPPSGPHLRWRIVGIVRRPLDLGDRAATGGVVVLTPAFDRAYAGRVGLFGTVLRVRARHHAADVRGIATAARHIFGPSPYFGVTDLSSEGHGAADAINVLTLALWIFAGVAALAGMVAIAIVLSREISHASVNPATLQSLGLTHRQRIAATGAPALIVAGAGALIAALSAFVASPLLPTGIARRADPSPGFHWDWLVFGPGLALTAALVVLVAIVAAARATRSPRSRKRSRRRQGRPTIADLAARAGFRPAFTNGLRMAMQRGRGEAAVPVGSACFGAAFGVAGIIAVVVFASSLAHLSATPRLYGWTWDFKASDNTFTNTCNADDFGVTRQAGVADVGVVCYQAIQIDGRPATGWGFRSVRGTIAPEILAGHAARGPDEAAIGSSTLHALGKKIGDSVAVTGGGKTRTFRIVGRAVFPQLSPGDIQPLADGAEFTAAGLTSVLDRSGQFKYVVGRFTAGADRAAVLRRIGAIPQFNPRAANARFATDEGAVGPKVPAAIERLRQVNWFTPTLASLLGALAIVAMGHALLSSVRRRRRELALLKSLGFSRRQVRATIAWQATTIVTIGLVFGIPIGLIVGSRVWRAVAHGLGVSPAPTLPAITVVLTAAGAIALVNLIASFPARAAAGTRPAVVFRSE